MEPYNFKNKYLIWIFKILGIVFIVAGVAAIITSIVFAIIKDPKFYIFVGYYFIPLCAGVALTYLGFRKPKDK